MRPDGIKGQRLNELSINPSWRGAAQIQNMPQGYQQSGWAVASDENYPGQIDRQVASIIVANRIIADYPGEDFYAYIWFSEQTWFAEIWKNHRIAGMEIAESIDELVFCIRKYYGIRAVQ